MAAVTLVAQGAFSITSANSKPTVEDEKLQDDNVDEYKFGFGHRHGPVYVMEALAFGL